MTGCADPHDIDDASATAVAYLCADGHDLTSGAGWADAIFGYNHDDSYVASVHSAASEYAAPHVLGTGLAARLASLTQVLTRRDVFRGLGLAVLAVGAVGLLDCCGDDPAEPSRARRAPI